MQAGLVSKRLTLSDIFTARGVSLRLFVPVVLVSVTVHLSRNLVQPSCGPRGRPIKERLLDQQRTAQAPSVPKLGGRECRVLAESCGR